MVAIIIPGRNGPLIAGGTSGAASTTWDPAVHGADIGLSGGNLIATATGTSTAYAYSTTTKSSGKLYLELTFGGGVSFLPTSWYFAIQDTSASFPTGYVFAQNDLWRVNNVSSGVTAAHPVSGNVSAFAIDFTNKRIWSKASVGADWNQNVSADPGTPSTGVDFSAAVVGGSFYFLFNSLDNSGSIITLNVGASAFAHNSGSPPSGFTAWG